MQSKMAAYRKEGALALRHMWFVVLIFTIIQFIMSVYVAHVNSNYNGGLKSLAFAAIWSMFLAIGFGALGAKIVFSGKSLELLVGFMIGIASMMAQLFFMLAVIFFALGTEAGQLGYECADGDKAYGTFTLINFIIYLVWAIILSVHRNAVTISVKELEASNSQQVDSSGMSAPTYNPALTGAWGNGGAVDEEAEL